MSMLLRRHRKKDEPVRDEPVSFVEEEQDFPKHTGGGWYELSDGDKVKGKEDAIKAEESLKEGE